MMPYIPNPLIEAANGIISILMLWMLFFGFCHLCRTFRHYRDHVGFVGAVEAIYQGNKPEIALLTFLTGLCARQSAFWYFRVLQDHGWTADNVISRNGPEITVVTTAVMIVGVTCWIRVISPYSGGRAAAIWLAMVTTALGIGVGVALIP